MTQPDFAPRTWELAQAVRRQAPLVHNLTNLVVQADSAAAIAAVGGTQITLHTAEEARAAAGVCAALAVNVGTLDEAWLRSVEQAVEVARERSLPWVLDPVAAGFSAYRRDATRALLEAGPSVLKGNASEILALAGEAGGGRGADSIHSVEQALEAAERLARRHGCVVVVTGEVDLITDGRRRLSSANGQPLLGAMIASGCMLGSVLGCFLAVSEDPFEAARAAVGWFTVAGELAAEQAGGPGTLKPLLIDALYGLQPEVLAQRLRQAAS